MPDLYNSSFSVLCGANAALATFQWRRAHTGKQARQRYQQSESDTELPVLESSVRKAADKRATRKFQTSFFSVYACVFASDWLQGPYIYSLYKDEKDLPERVVAFLFASGFVAAALSASFAGVYADKYGRRLACFCFCVVYAASCATMVSTSVGLLFIGRILGGFATTLLFSVFETWMVHEYHAQEMHEHGLELSSICGLMTTCSGVVAIVAGIVGEFLVRATDTKTAPFFAAIGCLMLAFLLIYMQWSENYGQTNQSTEKWTGIFNDVKDIIQDRQIVVLGLVCWLFEGTMYLFVFFWSAALKSARTTASNSSPPPFGLVFATFMSAMMLGSQIFAISTHSFAIRSTTPQLGTYMVLAALALLIIVNYKNETWTLWSFCMFEACVGLYFPSMGYLKSQMVHDGVRGKVYSMLRLPLNVFVVFTLALTTEGDRHRDSVFILCGGLLLLAYVASQRYLVSGGQ